MFSILVKVKPTLSLLTSVILETGYYETLNDMSLGKTVVEMGPTATW